MFWIGAALQIVKSQVRASKLFVSVAIVIVIMISQYCYFRSGDDRLVFADEIAKLMINAQT